MINFYIRTRGSKIDYSFLLEEPKDYLNNYRNNYKSDIEKPTCILERSQENKIYIFLSGIPSQRKDHQGTPIRYDLVATIDSNPLNGDWNNNPKEKKYREGLTGFIWMWLKDVRNAVQEIQEDGKSIELIRLPIASKSDLGRRLDDILPSEYIEELLQLTVDSKHSKDKKDSLEEKLKDLILEISTPTDLQELKYNYSTWWGGVKNDNSCNEWIKLVEKLLQDKNEAKGKALLLNIATPTSLDNYAKNDEELGVLLAKEWSSLKPEEIKIRDLAQTNTKIPKFMGNLLQNPNIPQETKKILKQFAEDGVKRRKQLEKLKKVFF